GLFNGDSNNSENSNNNNTTETSSPNESPEQSNESNTNEVNNNENVDLNMFKDYSLTDGIKYNPEEPMCTQDLYKILDSAVQAVVTDENANVEEIVKNAANDFQVNYLDRVE
ncbi:MAG: hypothetical protein RSA27_06290, partial [Oscillospiraceae bacterium]